MGKPVPATGISIPERGFDVVPLMQIAGDVSPDVDSGGKILRITPLKPWEASRGPAVNSSGPNAGRVFNVGYLVILTNGLKSASGTAMTPCEMSENLSDCQVMTEACQAKKPMKPTPTRRAAIST